MFSLLNMRFQNAVFQEFGRKRFKMFQRLNPLQRVHLIEEAGCLVASELVKSRKNNSGEAFGSWSSDSEILRRLKIT